MATPPRKASRVVAAAEANRQFSRILRDVASGQFVVVTSRGKPVAEMRPVSKDADASAEEKKRRDFQRFLDDLRARPVRHLGRFNRDDAYE
jgi:prevent-host-death family protein